MRSFPWPGDDGWPYRDSDGVVADGVEDLAAMADDDLLSLQAVSERAMATLEPLERQVIGARFGIDGTPLRSMKQLHADTGLPRAELRLALGSGLAKLRTHLT
jgi:DNA-directed RNA polymerase sigma subunit (sigma70/sigma32)